MKPFRDAVFGRGAIEFQQFRAFSPRVAGGIPARAHCKISTVFTTPGNQSASSIVVPTLPRNQFGTMIRWKNYSLHCLQAEAHCLTTAHMSRHPFPRIDKCFHPWRDIILFTVSRVVGPVPGEERAFDVWHDRQVTAIFRAERSC